LTLFQLSQDFSQFHRDLLFDSNWQFFSNLNLWYLASTLFQPLVFGFDLISTFGIWLRPCFNQRSYGSPMAASLMFLLNKAVSGINALQPSYPIDSACLGAAATSKAMPVFPRVCLDGGHCNTSCYFAIWM
jgi:hypothetical protein